MCMIAPKKYGYFLSIITLCIWLTSCTPKGKPALALSTENTMALDNDDIEDSVRVKAAHIVPSKNQFEALKDEFIAFVHFGPNTFTRMEWGNGMEDPAIFNLKNLNTDQWCQAMKDAGMKKVIITAKHHDGFVLWQSRYTKHGVMSSPYKNGEGDVVKELAASCKKYGIKLGVYLSPADLYQIEHPEGLYGNLSKYTKRTIPRQIEGRPFENKTTFEFEVDDYNEYFLNQLFELLTEYGPIDEVWFDGAHPKRKGNQRYKYRDWKKLITALAPNAVVFGKEGTRWCGNEAGATRDTEWNVVPYDEDPRTMNLFADITDEDVGSMKKLVAGKFLHYQPAETNTSIREGWFYRDDTDQKVRTTDDVFDIYERSVGGNSIFLLNIPPNREGEFSDQDVQVLKETGQRIKETYRVSLLDGADGPKELLDQDNKTHLILQDKEPIVEVTLPKATKINRFLVQEHVEVYGERVSEHALDAWINDEWKEVASATNIGYKRILRFPEIETTKLRLRILSSRYTPVLQHISAHYFKSRPPQLQFSRNSKGEVSIVPKMSDFGWNPNGENAGANLNKGMQIFYTTDGQVPNSSSSLFTDPFVFGEGEVKAVAIMNGEKGSTATFRFGIPKMSWTLVESSSAQKKHEGELLFDENPNTYWQSQENDGNKSVVIDLGKELEISAFAYTPPTSISNSMIEKGTIFSSQDGKVWTKQDSFTFGNLINDPTQRTYTFNKKFQARYIKLQANEIAGNGLKATIAELDFY
ncbi:alpha-L-fucosidase [Maribacter sedimenticola]|uniref:alpha-L-fucosidase n=1 Tax=Maribacter sedimenticola TaxID=228956 RepID=A0ABY1SFU9_9FLAO|nr:alpha-L-fucosidase [Maribacter sedimenticola]SNR40170.1 alpha-L-fucosidase [Maribacter sedimenticola]